MVFYRTCFLWAGLGAGKLWPVFLDPLSTKIYNSALEAGSFKFSTITNGLLAPQKSLYSRDCSG